MPTPVEITVADELLVAVILESWSIDDLRQLIEEVDAELRSRPTWPRGALRSRRARCPRGPRPMH
jgi:hypothetical protein